MTLFEILSDNERVLVHSDQDRHLIYTWNKSCTLQAWRQLRHFAEESPQDEWDETACQTLSDVPINIDAAAKAAMKWSTTCES